MKPTTQFKSKVILFGNLYTQLPVYQAQLAETNAVYCYHCSANSTFMKFLTLKQFQRGFNLNGLNCND